LIVSLKDAARGAKVGRQNGDASRRPRLLLALYEGKGLSIARAGAPSPLATLSGRQTSS